MSQLFYDLCPLCKSKDISKKMVCNDHLVTGELFDLFTCANCDFLFTQNPPTEEKIKKYYQSENYIPHSDRKKGIIYILFHFARNIMLKRKYRFIKKLPHSDKSILDIGTGTGYFLDFFKRRNFRVAGVEQDASARNFAKNEFGLSLIDSKMFLRSGIKDKYSFISLWHVLEHLYNPFLYMEEIDKILNDDGHLIVALPNPNSFDARYYSVDWDPYDVPRHLWHFTPEVFEKFVDKCKYKIIARKRLPFDPFYNAIFSEKKKGSKLILIRGLFIGLISFINSLIKKNQSSSIVYILKKA